MKNLQSFDNFIFNNYLYESFTEKDIRMYAWLYFLVYVYPEGMEEKSWINDNRMGINFLESVKYFENKKLTKKVGTKWFANPIAKDEVKLVFGLPKNRMEAEEDNRFEKFNTKNYKIGNIPYEIFNKEERNIINQLDVNLKFTYKEYDIIRKWYAKYERESKGWNNILSRYVGALGDLVMNENYILYRGLNLLKRREYEIGELIEDTRMSWTSSLNMAIRFAYGNDNWMKNNNKIGKDFIGIVLRREFHYTEILLDTNFVDSKHPYLKSMVSWPDEYEVIVKPSKKKAEIIKIFE